MKTLALFLAASMVAAAFVVPADAAGVSFDGKKTSFHTVTAIPLPASPGGPVLSGTIALGKKKNVLKIDAMVTSENFAPFAPWTLNAFVDVNGTPVDPTVGTAPFGAVQDCSGAAAPFAAPAEGCTVAGTWIFDIDAAETASPGCCYNVPLTVHLSAGPGMNPVIPGIPTSASLSVLMTQKK